MSSFYIQFQNKLIIKSHEAFSIWLRRLFLYHLEHLIYTSSHVDISISRYKHILLLWICNFCGIIIYLRSRQQPSTCWSCHRWNPPNSSLKVLSGEQTTYQECHCMFRDPWKREKLIMWLRRSRNWNTCSYDWKI